MRRFIALAMTTAVVLAFNSVPLRAQTWQMPPDNQRCPSKWGAGDQRGAANMMKPETVLRAAQLIKTGEIFELGAVLSPDPKEAFINGGRVPTGLEALAWARGLPLIPVLVGWGPAHSLIETTEHWYCVISGAARKYALLSDGRRRIIDFLLPGDFFGFRARHPEFFATDAIALSSPVSPTNRGPKDER